MSALIPTEFLFRYSFAAKQADGLPRRGKRLLDLGNEYTLPSVSELANRRDFGSVRIAWNARGLGISVTVEGKSHSLICDPSSLGNSDGLRVWIDSRCTQSIHRAGRFCHQFELLPTGGGDDGTQPIATLWPVARAQEDPPDYDSELIPIQSVIDKRGYTLEAWLPADALHGFDPEHQPRLGFTYALRDAEFGLQCLSVDERFPFMSDPSLWCTLELISE